MKLLLVEDDPALANSTTRALQSQGWTVDWTTRGEPVPQSLRQDAYDVVVLDIGLAGIDGFETLRRVRAQGTTTPVLMLTARDAVEDRVRGLEGGADDYLVKPFALAELVARVRVLSRRAQARSDDALTLGELRMDLAARRVFVGDKALEISAREWSVLEFLLARVGKVVAKEQILQAIAGWDESLSGNAIEVYVSRLRAKLEPAGLRIRTVRGFGYLLETADAAP
ncbi:MAG: response regulator transcription factor [Burkholderiales bacterium]|nr:response regulator transcription factor [Burkholderiales bacterium]MDE1926780.1 response regulator transcription factor [Burkholderiales bacterium]MDE2158277.1 response regulator transcription factor [Burkholderiales bacterium]MDE2502257.1 response regulator transcription factor [Burkholderiales bacterium]